MSQMDNYFVLFSIMCGLSNVDDPVLFVLSYFFYFNHQSNLLA